MSRYISKLPPEIRELAEKRRSECKHGFGFSSILVDAFSWADTKEGYSFWESMLNENYSVFYTLYPNKNCTCNSRTVDEQGNVVHFEECEKEKDKLDELIDFIEDELDKADAGNITLKKIVYAKILNKAKEIKGK